LSGVLFAVAVLAAIGIVVFRKVSAAYKRKQLTAELEKPTVVTGYDEVDAHVRRARCPDCGGYLATIGEGAGQSGGKSVHVVRTKCDSCNERFPLVFDVSEVPN
jgi:hypothetical protein